MQAILSIFKVVYISASSIKILFCYFLNSLWISLLCGSCYNVICVLYNHGNKLFLLYNGLTIWRNVWK